MGDTNADLTQISGLEFTPEIIRLWNTTMVSETDVMEDGVIEVLEYLKSKDKSLVVLTNWYSLPQVERLKNAGIFEYFDDVSHQNLYYIPTKHQLDSDL